MIDSWQDAAIIAVIGLAVKTPRFSPAYLRFRTEAEYTAFALKWS